MAVLCVNIDHVATVRQARRTFEPDPVAAAMICEASGAEGITIHLREDRRHIQDRDLRIIRQVVKTRLNLEMAATKEMVAIALDVKPDMATLVPEKREEITTEGGLDVAGLQDRIADVTRRLRDGGIRVSLFINPDPVQIEAAGATDADAIELNTGAYANARQGDDRRREWQVLTTGAQLVRNLGLALNAGHGLTYQNVLPVAAIEGMGELNIGHSIVSYAVLYGMAEAVREMKRLIDQATQFPSLYHGIA
ncbi:pyridoxine 5'-phosphate synthase [Candidatus Sumerlaeota bacterium]|nr:pyridoxine 5'-phosphate synthase [Candidatus Sumerlaeota bacterium]